MVDRAGEGGHARHQELYISVVVVLAVLSSEFCSEILNVVVHEEDEGRRRVTGAVTEWQCAPFITWPVTHPFMVTLRPRSVIHATTLLLLLLYESQSANQG